MKFSLTFRFLILLSIIGISFKELLGQSSQKGVKIAFKTLLKSEGLSIDPHVPNRYESIQIKNKYSNHYFNFSTDLPDNWEIDRGNAMNTVIRSMSQDSGSQISIIVVPFQSSKSHKAFQENPLKLLNESSGGSYFNLMKKVIQNNVSEKAFDFNISVKKIRSINYVVFSYKYIEVTDDVDIEFTSTQYQTNLWNSSYSFNYSTPSVFYSEATILDVLFSTNYINPNVSFLK